MKFWKYPFAHFLGNEVLKLKNKMDFTIIKERTGLNGEEFLQLLLDSIPVEIFVKGLDGVYLYANEIQCKNDKLERSEILGKRDEELFGEELYPIYSETDREVLKYGKEMSFTSDSVLTKNLKTFKAPFKKQDGTVIGIAGYSYDSTEIIYKIKELEKKLGRYEGVFNDSPIGIAIYNTLSGRALEINWAFNEITGRSTEELMTLPWESYSHGAEIQENHHYLELMVGGKIEGFNMEKRFIRPDGSIVWVDMTIKKYKDEINRDAHIVMAIDITSRKEAETKAKFYYDHDALTGLYNRKSGDEKLLELDKPVYWPLSIIVADANGLKVANDAFGHSEGDRLIKKLASIFLTSIGEGNYVVRTGGDEFMVILPNTSGSEALELIRKIDESFEENHKDGFLLSMAMGCATKSSSEDSIDLVYQTAEARMYHNKIQDSNAHKIKTIESLQQQLENQNPSIREHCIKVKKYAIALGEMVGLSEEALRELGIAAYYHDIGKVGLDQSIIDKKESLDQRDWVSVMKHPEVGYQILKSVTDYARIAEYVLFHHERVDGVGYPTSSKAREIPLQSRILALAEAYSDMTLDRAYRKKLTKEEAIREIRNGSGTQFDDNLVDIFINKILANDGDL